MSSEQAAQFLRSERDRTATERALFEARVGEWATRHRREWVLIKGDDVRGFFASFEEAFVAGEQAFPTEDLFIKQVVPPQEVQPVSLGLLHGVLVVDD